MEEAIRWGILGTGAIARKFAEAIQSLPDALLVAVGSRSREKAEEFGNQFAVPNRYSSYEALMTARDVDAVYVATPHSCHKKNALAAIAAKKAVLVEKPFTINSAEAEAVIQAAGTGGVLVMEAMWTRFLPLYVHLRRVLAEGIIGQVRLMSADFGIKSSPNTRPRLFDLSLGGGALLDVGVYPVSIASMVLGSPSGVKGAGHIGPTGVDETCAFLLSHPGGQMVAITCAITVATSLEFHIMGTAGRIRIHAPLWKSTAMTLIPEGGEPTERQFPYPGNGYQLEATEFMQCLRSKKLESNVMPLAETLSVMRTMDDLRTQWGLRYPTES